MIAGSDELVQLLPGWQAGALDMYMLYPFQLSSSNLLSAFFDVALEGMGSTG